jgi:multidrug efflux pump
MTCCRAAVPDDHAGPGHGVGDVSRRRLEDARDSVASPIEQQINGVDNMLYMSSTSSSTGQLTLTVYFSLDTDPDIAQVQVQNRVNLALPQLPTAVTQHRRVGAEEVVVDHDADRRVREGDRLQRDYVANYANVYVLDALKRVHGAGQAQIMGVPDQAMRIWMNPDRMARSASRPATSRTRSSSRTAVRRRQIGSSRTRAGRAHVPGRHAGAVHRSAPVREHHPAREPGRQRDRPRRRRRARRESACSSTSSTQAQRHAGDASSPSISSRARTAHRVQGGARRARGHEEPFSPRGWTTRSRSIRTISCDCRSRKVIHTLFEALALVVLIVYLFLQSFRTTIICAVRDRGRAGHDVRRHAGDGFSINLLTLFGLVLAIGMVVDDAIVVVENVERNMAQHHLEPKEATIRSMGEIASSLVAVVLVMSSVFIPAAFLPGTTGQLYKQFAITIVVSVPCPASSRRR